MFKKISLLLLVLLSGLKGLAQDFRSETIYFVLTTRFYDGDPTNNRPNEWSSYIPGVTNPNITDPNDVTWRGDFKGLIEKLDYIKDLGFTAIWVTPIVQNRSPLDYHGYHTWDFTKVDPRYESLGATFPDLVSAAHAKGLKVVLDIVTNHSGRHGIKGVSELKYNTDPAKVWGQKTDGTPLPLVNPNWQYDGLTPNPDDGKIWSRANVAPLPAPHNANPALYNWPSTMSHLTTVDPTYFHQSGNGFAQGWDDTENLYNRALHEECPDLNTASTQLRNYLINAYAPWIQIVDGLRWDTMKHMDRADVLAFYDAFKAINPNIFVVGEVAQKRHELHNVEEINPHWYTWRGVVNGSTPSGISVFDFYAEATFHNIFQDGGGFSGVTAAARYDNLYSDPGQLVTWLDNHDFGPNNDWNQRYGGTDENLAACMNFMFTWRGIPSVYYGTENRFKSGAYTDIHDASGITKSIDQTGRAYFGSQFASAPNHVIYKHIKRLNQIRKAVPALQKGTWSWAGNAPGNGVGYWREFGSSKVAVGLAKDGAASFNFSGLPNGTYKDAVTGRSVTVSSGSLAFTVTSGSAGIYVLNGPGMIGENGGFFENCVNCIAAAPNCNISPVGTNYNTPQTVSIAANGGVGPYTIRYTTNGTMPTTSSTIYTAPLSVNSRTTIRAIAIDSRGVVSELSAQQYTFDIQAPSVSITPISGNYYTSQTVSLSATGGTAPRTIYYTTDGTTPTTNSPVYASSFSVSSATTIKAITKDANNVVSPVASASYTFNIPNPTVSASPGSVNTSNPPVNITLTAVSPRTPVTIRYTTDGSTPTASSSVYSGPLSLGSSGSTTPVTLKFYATDTDGRVSTIQTETYTFNPIPTLTIYFKKPAAWGTAVKVYAWTGTNTEQAGAWPGAAMVSECNGWYSYTFSALTTVNLIFNEAGNKTPDQLNRTTTSWLDGSSLTTGTNNGWASSWVTSPPSSYGSAPVVSLSPATATFSTTQSVTLTAAACSGTVPTIYYTTDGTTPTTGSISGSGPITLNFSATTTVKAMAVNSVGTGAVATGTYTKSVTPVGITVYFKRPTSWTVTPSIYSWTGTNTTQSGAWPGTAMTAMTCSGWYKFTLPSSLTSVNLIFNNGSGGSGNQSADILNVTTSSWYDATAGISSIATTSTAPAVFMPVLGVNPTGPQSSSSAIPVTLSANACGEPAFIYYTTNGTTPTTSSTNGSGSVNLTIANTTTLQAMAIFGGQTTTVQTHVYTINSGCGTSTVNESVATGNWHSPSTWSCGSIPIAGQNVRINTGHTVTLQAGNGNALNLDNRGVLHFNTGTWLNLGL